MITLVRGDAELGDPPKEYKNNGVEASNFMIKYALEFDAKNHMTSSGQSGILYIYNTKIKKQQFWEKFLTE